MRETEDRWTTADVSSGEGREMKNEEEDVMREELGVGGFTNMDGVGDTKPRSRESRGDWRVLADGNPVDVVVGEGLKGCCAVGRWVMVGVAKRRVESKGCGKGSGEVEGRVGTPDREGVAIISGEVEGRVWTPDGEGVAIISGEVEGRTERLTGAGGEVIGEVEGRAVNSSCATMPEAVGKGTRGWGGSTEGLGEWVFFAWQIIQSHCADDTLASLATSTSELTTPTSELTTPTSVHPRLLADAPQELLL